MKDGRLRGIAVTSATRTAAAPEFPTIAEIVNAVDAAGTRRRFLDPATDPASSTPEELAAYTRREIVKWPKLTKQACIKAE